MRILVLLFRIPKDENSAQVRNRILSFPRLDVSVDFWLT